MPDALPPLADIVGRLRPTARARLLHAVRLTLDAFDPAHPVLPRPAMRGGTAPPATLERATGKRLGTQGRAAAITATEHQPSIAEQLDEDLADVLAALRSGGDWAEALRANAAQWETRLRDLYQDGGARGGRATWRGLQPLMADEPTGPLATVKALVLGPEDAPWLGQILDYLLGVSSTKIKNITETTIDAVRIAIADSEAAGETIAQMMTRIAGSTGFSDARAETIARTESLTAASVGSHAAARASGVELYKVWRCQRDDRVRAAHLAADKQRQPLEEPYEVGGEELRFPSDPAGSAGNVINCRCVELYEPAA